MLHASPFVPGRIIYFTSFYKELQGYRGRNTFSFPSFRFHTLTVVFHELGLTHLDKTYRSFFHGKRFPGRLEKLEVYSLSP